MRLYEAITHALIVGSAWAALVVAVAIPFVALGCLVAAIGESVSRRRRRRRQTVES